MKRLLLLLVLLLLCFLIPIVSAGPSKLPIWNPFGNHLQWLMTGFDSNLTKDFVWNSLGSSAVLNTTINAAVTTIYVRGNNTMSDFPSSGVLKIDSEAIVYGNFTYNSTLNCSVVEVTRRGAYDTTAASHTALATIYFVKMLVGFNETTDPYFSITTDRKSGFNNIIPQATLGLDADDIVLELSNSTGGRVLRVNTTSAVLEVWHPAEAAGDYVFISHDATNGFVNSGSGVLALQTAGTTRLIADGANSNVRGGAANTYDLGSASVEWKGFYVAEDAGTGVYWGLDQNWNMFYNETTDDALWLVGLDDFNIATTDLKIWDDAKATNDYINVWHDATNGYIRPQSGVFYIGAAGNSEITVGTNYLYPTSTGDTDLGGATAEWKTLYLSNGTGSGLFFEDAQTSTLMSSNSQATAATLVWGLQDTTAYGDSLIITDNTHLTDDYDHPSQSSPTVFVQGSIDPDTDNTRWGSLAHDNTSFVVDSGSDAVVLDDSTWIAGNLSTGDKAVGGIAYQEYCDATACYMDARAQADRAVKLYATQLEVWDDDLASNDYVSLYHTSVYGALKTESGDLYLIDDVGNSVVWSGSMLYPYSANTPSLGGTANEWKTLYLGNDTTSGIYFGMGQESRLYFNNTVDSLVLVDDVFKIVGGDSFAACSADLAGAIAYNTTEFKHYGCNSTDWVALY